MKTGADPNPGVALVNKLDAFRHFAEFRGATQSQLHIRPLHEYVTSRLVLEGGFRPSELSPRPPLRTEEAGNLRRVAYAPQERTQTEATILGGLKTKKVDIVVSKDGIGPVLAISCKGMTGAVRNLTNRLEETIGECTNIHLSYPTLVFGYLFLMRANREGENAALADAAFDSQGRPLESIVRFHQALSGMTGRLNPRNDSGRYEAIAMALVEVSPPHAGAINADYPPRDSAIHFDQFFKTIYRRYDERYVMSAPRLVRRTRRLEWSCDSPALDAETLQRLDYRPRVAG